MKYDAAQPVDRDHANSVFAHGTAEEIASALVSVTFHDPDWRWVQARCLEFLSSSNPIIRGIAVTCLGHLARIHHDIDRDVVVPALEELLSDAQIGGRAEDALTDIRMFVR